MNLGEVNKGAVILIVALLFGAGGFLFYSGPYKSAVAAHTIALKSATDADAQLTAAKQQLTQAQAAIDAAKKESAKVDDSVARLAKARTAVPPDKLIDDAAIVLMEQAQKAGVQTKFTAGGGEGDAVTSATATPGESSLDGATPIDIEFEAAGTYSEMMAFMQLVEATVEESHDKLYTRGRLFNVVSLVIGTKEDDSSGGFGTEKDDNAFVLGPNDLKFTVTVRMYASSNKNASGVGEATPDPAASGTGTGTGTDAATNSTTGGATGSTAPTTSGGAATGTTPSSTSATGAATGGSS